VDPCWIKPVDSQLAVLAERHRLVVTVEDNGRVGGVGSTIAQILRDACVVTPLRDFGLPQRFLGHGKRAEILAEAGLSPQDISRQIVETVACLDDVLDQHSPVD
jgi:1-deoxy-D-xylulose-5-phosphate synthase